MNRRSTAVRLVICCYVGEAVVGGTLGTMGQRE